jgi:hypothetical protein
MSITTALQSICTHRDVVPLYYDRRTGSFIVTGVFRTKSGAFVVDADGRIGKLHDTKRAALASINPN